jgi:hypothetical protein
MIYEVYEMKYTKHFFLIVIIILTIGGCTQIPHHDDIPLHSNVYSVSQVPAMLIFSSVEDFMRGYNAIVTERADSDLTSMATAVNFSSLEKLYLPMGIPETFRLHRIEIHIRHINMIFLPEESLVSDQAINDADVNSQFITYRVSRWDTDDPRSGIIEQNSRHAPIDFIDDNFFFIEWAQRLHWFSDREAMTLFLPQRASPGSTGLLSMENSVDGKIVYDDVRALAPFTEMMVIDLRDEASVAAARAAFRN